MVRHRYANSQLACEADDRSRTHKKTRSSLQTGVVCAAREAAYIQRGTPRLAQSAPKSLKRFQAEGLALGNGDARYQLPRKPPRHNKFQSAIELNHATPDRRNLRIAKGREQPLTG